MYLEKLGYYEVNNQKFYSKIEALDHAGRTNSQVNFIYNDSIFASYNWTQEPEPNTGIQEFYRRRAQQLRDSYDYIVMMYSGGPDSTMMLETFAENNIYIDEIVNFNSYDRTSVVQGTVFNADYFYNVRPRLEELSKTHNNIGRVSILDEIEFTRLHWNDVNRWGDSDLVLGAYSWPTAWVLRGVWIKFVPHIWDRLQSGQRVGVLYGSDKTRLQIKNGRYCTWFMDFSGPDAAALVANDPDFKNTDFIEYFFHSPDCVPMIIKQAHLLKNFVETQATAQDFEELDLYSRANQRARSYCISKRHSGNLKPNRYSDVVYPGIHLPILTHKPGEMLLRTNDSWWVQQMETKDVAIWKNGLMKLLKDYRHLVNSQQGVTNLPHLNSNTYYLEL